MKDFCKLPGKHNEIMSGIVLDCASFALVTLCVMTKSKIQIRSQEFLGFFNKYFSSDLHPQIKSLPKACFTSVMEPCYCRSDQNFAEQFMTERAKWRISVRNPLWWWIQQQKMRKFCCSVCSYSDEVPNIVPVFGGALLLIHKLTHLLLRGRFCATYMK